MRGEEISRVPYDVILHLGVNIRLFFPSEILTTQQLFFDFIMVNPWDLVWMDSSFSKKADLFQD